MKISLIPLTLFAVAISSLVACKKTNQNNNDSILVPCSLKTKNIDSVGSLISGVYNWAYSTITARGVESYNETPQTINQNRKYIFDKNGTVYYFVNNKQEASYKYEVDYEFKVTNYPLDSSTVIIFSDKQTDYLVDFYRIKICNDSAILTNPYNSISKVEFYKRN
jgi:hypothetical protein